MFSGRSGPGRSGTGDAACERVARTRGRNCLRRAGQSGNADWAPVDAEIIFAGKRAGEKTFSQDEINALLIEKSRLGKNVVRLKGGDPFIFGRGGEEAEALAAAGIDFELVPGITSALAAPAYARI